MDFRFQTTIRNYLVENGFVDDYDLVSYAGSSKNLDAVTYSHKSKSNPQSAFVTIINFLVGASLRQYFLPQMLIYQPQILPPFSNRV